MQEMIVVYHDHDGDVFRDLGNPSVSYAYELRGTERTGTYCGNVGTRPCTEGSVQIWFVPAVNISATRVVSAGNDA